MRTARFSGSPWCNCSLWAAVEGLRRAAVGRNLLVLLGPHQLRLAALLLDVVELRVVSPDSGRRSP
jgi:hypothetical protein